MTPADAALALLRMGLTPRSDGAALYLSPQDALTPEALALAKEHKVALIEALAGPAGEALLRSLGMELEAEAFFRDRAPGPPCPPVAPVSLRRMSDGSLVPSQEAARWFPPDATTGG